MEGRLAGVRGPLRDFFWCSGSCCLRSSCRGDWGEAVAGASGLGDECPVSARLKAGVLESGVWFEALEGRLEGVQESRLGVQLGVRLEGWQEVG
jgi:hypothetical protein